MSWTEQILQSLKERDVREKAHSSMIQHCQQLTVHAVMLKERNAALLRAAAASAAAGSSSSSSGGSVGTRSSGSDNAVQAAFINSLEAQLAQMRQDLSEQYKIQSTNAQRLLLLTDQLRAAEERGREDKDELRTVTNEVEGLRERARWHKEVVAEKERQILILQDDHASLELELHQLTLQNQDLKTDNASLLQRWIEAKTKEVERMNATFEQESALMKGGAAIDKPEADVDAEAEKGKGKEKA